MGGRILGAYAAQRIAGIISILDGEDPEERARHARDLDVPPTRLTLGEPWNAGAVENSEDAKEFVGLVAKELVRQRPLQVLSIRRADGMRPERLRGGDAAGQPAELPSEPGTRPFMFIVAQTRLSDGAVLTIRHVVPEHSQDWPLRVLGLICFAGLVVTLLAAWVVRRLTRPLASLAEAASGLARNLDQAPLPENGPQEVSRAAGAFNAMQRELKLYLESRAQALAGVSHDLRLPITRLRLRLEHLPDGELKSGIEGELAEMDGMIGETLEFLRAGSAAEKPALLDLNALLEAVVEDMEALGARIRVDGKALAPVRARPRGLQRCLSNLLDNARHYGGGDIDVRVRDSGDEVEIRVEDRGPGIPSPDMDRVFEPYVRLESSRARHTGGTGLGLPTARAIARVHGGDVTLESRSGGGLVAVLKLSRASGGW
jgi:signal transduction histidine kinase